MDAGNGFVLYTKNSEYKVVGFNRVDGKLEIILDDKDGNVANDPTIIDACADKDKGMELVVTRETDCKKK